MYLIHDANIRFDFTFVTYRVTFIYLFLYYISTYIKNCDAEGFNLDLFIAIYTTTKRIYLRLCYHATGLAAHDSERYTLLSDLHALCGDSW